jgi:uncharacterized SAM-binding protein YcdF (DUF218 family)
MILIILGNKHYDYRMNQRVKRALSLFLSSPQKYTQIIPTGGVTQTSHSEAFYMKQRLISGGVPIKKITLENRAMDTIENAKYTKKMVGNKKIVVVTSKSHVRRAKKIFQKIYDRKNIKFYS